MRLKTFEKKNSYRRFVPFFWLVFILDFDTL